MAHDAGGLDVRVVSPITDLLDRFEVAVDPTADPVDFEEALADFLLGIVEKRRAARPTSPCRSGRSDARLGMLEAATGGTQ